MAQASMASRRERPRVCQRAKGARAPKRCDPVATKGSSSAPAPVACRAEGAVTSSAGFRSGSRSLRESLSRPGPRAAARRLDAERRCATGVRAGCCHALHSLDPRPRNLRRAKPRVRRPRRYRRLPQPGHRPRPASAAQLMRPMWTGVRGVWGRCERAGISFRYRARKHARNVGWQGQSSRIFGAENSRA